MSDMRDFNMPPEEILSEDIRPVNFSESRNALSDEALTNEGLGEFHVVEAEEASNTGRIVGALAVALLLGTAGIYAYESSRTSSAGSPNPVTNQVASTGPTAPANAAPPSSSATNMAPAPQPDAQAPAAQTPATEPSSIPAPAKARPVIRAARNENSGSTDVQTPEVTPAQVAPTPGLPTAPVQTGQAQPATPNPALANNIPADNSAADVSGSSGQAAQPDTSTAAPAVQPAPLQPTPVQPDQAAPAQPAAQ